MSASQPSDDGTKYRVTAAIEVDGVVERSDVVGAVYGQTEGLLGSELDLRTLQRASKVSRLDVSIESEAGRTEGTLTIDSRLDKPETAILAAALETIDQIGPCSGSIAVRSIEDVRTATRREVADRAKELLAEGFDDGLAPSDLVSDVKQSARRETITTYEGLPAGPHVETSDSLVVVEGRSDVRRLLECGLKNVVATEGTDVPAPVAVLSQDRTTTVFVDGDRGGELLGEELRQVGAIDFVAVAPDGQSVEDLDRSAVFQALREKVPADSVVDTGATEETGSDGEKPASPSAGDDSGSNGREEHTEPDDEAAQETAEAVADPTDAVTESDGTVDTGAESDDPVETVTESDATVDSGAESDGTADAGAEDTPAAPDTVPEHAAEAERSGVARILDADGNLVRSVDVESILDGDLEAGDGATVVLPATLTQAVLDRLAEGGVSRVVASETGEFVKQPANVRVTRLDDLDRLEA